MVEIYFVLYLAALVLLITDTGNQGGTDTEDRSFAVVQHDFSIQPEKTSLNCRLVRDTSGIRMVSFDSVNTIFYTGNVEDVNFEFEVENPDLKRKVSLNTRNNSSRFFRFEELPEQQAARFYWQPPMTEKTDKNYIVRVTAAGSVKDENNEATHSLQVSTRFGLNISYLNEYGYPPLDTSGRMVMVDTSDPEALSRLSNEAFMSRFNDREVKMRPFEPDLRSVALHTWENKIWVSNIDLKDGIKEYPKVTTENNPNENSGTARIVNIEDGVITLRGKTPYAGYMNVWLSLTRKFDNKTYKTKFKVAPQSLPTPEYPSEMYPGVEYTIKPNLPLVDEETEALLSSDDEVIAVSKGNPIKYKPDNYDIGKELSLKRFIGSELLDKFQIRIKNFDEPEILKLTKTDFKKVRVETMSHGIYNGKENYVNLELIEGNARIREKFGQQRDKKDEMKYYQFFDIVPKNENEPFKFKIRASDRRGRTSSVEKFSEQLN